MAPLALLVEVVAVLINQLELRPVSLVVPVAVALMLLVLVALQHPVKEMQVELEMLA
jgi:hypothetical protein